MTTLGLPLSLTGSAKTSQTNSYEPPKPSMYLDTLSQLEQLARDRQTFINSYCTVAPLSTEQRQSAQTLLDCVLAHLKRLLSVKQIWTTLGERQQPPRELALLMTTLVRESEMLGSVLLPLLNSSISDVQKSLTETWQQLSTSAGHSTEGWKVFDGTLTLGSGS